MLPGQFGSMVGAASGGGGGPIALTYVDAATSTSDVITAPGGIASGDLAIYIDHAQNSSGSPTAVTPSGFTNFFNYVGSEDSGSDTVRVMISYKVLAGSETTITGMNGTSEDNKCMFVYRPSSGISNVLPLAGASWKKQIGVTSNPSSQSTSMSGKSVPLLYIALVVGNSSNNFSTQSPAFDATSTTTDGRFGRKLYNSSPQNHTVDANDLGRTSLVSGYIQVN